MSLPRKKRCEKIRYASEQVAEKFLKHIRATTSKAKKQPKRVYYCSDCLAWHLTSSSGSAKYWDRILELTKKLEEIRQVFADYKKADNKAIRIEAKSQYFLDQYRKQMNRLQSDLTRLRKDQHALISKNLQLEKQIKQLTPDAPVNK